MNTQLHNTTGTTDTGSRIILIVREIREKQNETLAKCLNVMKYINHGILN